MTLVEELAGWVHDLRHEQLPVAVVESASHRVLDTVGIAIAGRLSDAGRAVRALVDPWGGVPAAALVGEHRRLPAEAAALVNGTYAHALDFDDTHLPSIVHPSAPLVPAVLAQAEAIGASGDETAIALVAGYEVLCRLAMAQYDPQLGNSVLFERGFHATSILGTVAGAAACARLLGLSADGIAHAMAVSCSLGAGIIESNRGGGSVKPLHAGWAAHGAVSAGRLAAAGLTGPSTVLEGRFGLFSAFCGEDWRPEEVVAGLGEEWATPAIHFKPYPCNHFTHAVVDAAIRFRERGLSAASIHRVHIGTATPSWRTIGDPIGEKRRPRSPYHAQFSAPFVFATALIGGSGLGVAAADFTDETLREPKRRRLAGLCDVEPDPRCDAIFPEQFPAIVTVEIDGGRVETEFVLTNRGGPDRPLTRSELRAKLALTAGGSADVLARACEDFDVAAILRGTLAEGDDDSS